MEMIQSVLKAKYCVLKDTNDLFYSLKRTFGRWCWSKRAVRVKSTLLEKLK